MLILPILKKLKNLRNLRNLDKKQLSLESQIKKEIGNRIIAFTFFMITLIIGLTAYDISENIKELQSNINERIKSLEDFTITQMMLNNPSAIDVKLRAFNHSNTSFKLKWHPDNNINNTAIHHQITWKFPFSWHYDYTLGKIAGYQFGYFKVSGSLFSSRNVLDELLFRLGFLIILVLSVSFFLLPLAKKIPALLFVNPINRFIDLFSNSHSPDEISPEKLPAILPKELKELEIKIINLLEQEKKHERNKAIIEIGHVSARVAHDIRSPLMVMEILVSEIKNQIPESRQKILSAAIQSVRDIANNILIYYRNNGNNTAQPNFLFAPDENTDGNIIRPILLYPILDLILRQKKQEWQNNACEIQLDICKNTHNCWIYTAPNALSRTLSNLLNNAYEALTLNKTRKIHIHLSIKNQKLRLVIADTGSGIPQHEITSVLAGKSLKHGGEGLGLSGAKKYMASLHGKLFLKTQLRQGTKISLFFPVFSNLSPPS